ncbi:membrane protein S25 [Saimiriine betaherpesvirus 4]|uniref:Membrane protein S25 n=1 Tax=Saimiriine betaherpesvirus 4 TaxID=1535247 RepID=G8XT51_9BETA|nr:membrane protein S25 [Saimiriine betaherpesvirus 4]AEV81000.1 membrane protein S25 [Saimiriine betaherpesvirus 4]
MRPWFNSRQVKSQTCRLLTMKVAITLITGFLSYALNLIDDVESANTFITIGSILTAIGYVFIVLSNPSYPWSPCSLLCFSMISIGITLITVSMYASYGIGFNLAGYLYTSLLSILAFYMSPKKFSRISVIFIVTIGTSLQATVVMMIYYGSWLSVNICNVIILYTVLMYMCSFQKSESTVSCMTKTTLFYLTFNGLLYTVNSLRLLVHF